MQRLLTILLFVCCVVLVRAASIPIAILSPDFSASYRPYWSLNGTSSIVNNKLQLTDDVTNQSGTAFWTGTVCNSNGFKFSSFFSFTITHSGSSGSYADGLAFIIQQYANSWGAPGGGLGYEGLPGKSIAIEYDTYQNSNYHDPDINHIAIDFDGSVEHPDNTYYANSSKLNKVGITLTAGKTFYSWIDYDGETLQVRISTTTTRPATAVFSYNCDLASYFDGANVYYGFGGATGASTEKNIINSAYINNDYTPIDLTSNTYTQKAPSVSTTAASICRGESYTFNGTTYTTAGTYVAHLTNVVGCDSTATLQLTIREPSSSTTTASICRGESYTFNGTADTTAGTYTAHLVNAVGCDSTATLQLSVREPSSSTTNASICRGESYTFNGTTYTTAGTYVTHLTNAVGCDSAATLVLAVREPSSSTTNVSICRGDSYMFNGTTYATAGTYVAHLTNAVGCDSTATLQLIVREPSSSTTNASICRGDSYTFNGTTYTTAGTYVAHLTNAVGCDSAAILQLSVREPSNSTTIASICLGENYTFNGVTYTAAGTYATHLANAVGCDSTATLQLSVREPSSSTTNASICLGESYTFNGVTYTTDGTYATHLTNAVGCDSTATLQLIVKEPSSSTTTALICRGESYTFNGVTYTTAGTYQAHLVNAVGCDSAAALVLAVKEPSSSITTTSICRGESYAFNGTTYISAGTYVAHLTNAVGCDSTATLVLKSKEPSGSTTAASICRGESYAFNGETYTTAGTYAAHLPNAVGCDSTATLQLSVREPSSSTTNASICRGDSYTFNSTTYTTAGTYVAHLTNAVGCDSTATLQLIVREPSSSTTNASICRGESYTFNGTTYATAGTYATHLTNAVGCDSTATLQLSVREQSSSTTTASICRGESYTFTGTVYTTAGNYVAHLTNAVGCDSTATLQLSVREPSSSTTTASICRGDSYTFNGTTYTTAGTYVAHLTNVVGCDSTATLQLTVREPSSSTTTASICRGENYLFNGVIYTTAGTYVAHLINAVGCDSIVTLQLAVREPSSSTTTASICRGESYTFNGAVYTTAGTYVAHLINAVGCDSTATLQLIVKEPSSFTTTALICRGESYTFNGVTYTTAGTYQAHLVNAVGCDSTATLQLAVKEPSSSTTTASICLGENYTFNGVTYTTAGTYATHLTNAVGCDSIATLQLTVREPSSSTTNASICRGESYTFNGLTYTTAGTYAAHLTNAVGCDSTATLVLKVKEPSSSTTNATICRGESYAFNGTAYTSAGAYAAHLTNAVGCDSTATLQLSVRELSNSTTAASICRGESYTFNGEICTTAGTYAVHLINAVGCDSTATLVLKVKEPSSSTTTASICLGENYPFNGTTYSTAGIYVAHLANAVGCDSTATLELTVREPSSSTTTALICRGESSAFNGTTYATAGTYVAHLTNAVGCDSTATLVLKIKEPSSSITTASICHGQNYTFNGVTYAAAGTYAAHLTNAVGCDSTATLILAVKEPSSSTTTASICRGENYLFNGVTYTTAGNYVVHLVNAVGCDSTATLQLSVREPSSSTTTASICLGENYSFNGKVYTTAGTYVAHLTNAVGCDSTATLQLTIKEPSSSTTTASICRGENYLFNGVTYTATGTYAAHLVNAVGCDSTATLQLTVREPSSSITTASICRGESYTFSGTTYSNAGNYVAHLTNVVGCDSTATLQLTIREPSSSATNVSICRGESYTFNGTTYTTAGTYLIHLINAVGCDSTATLVLKVKELSSSTTTASICRGESYMFNGVTYTTAGTYAAHLVNAVGCDSTATLVLKIKEPSSSITTASICHGQNYTFNGVTYAAAGTYAAHLTNAVGCDSTATLILAVKEPSSSTTTASICRGESYTFNGTTYSTAGTYTTHLTNAVGCDSTATLVLEVKEPSISTTNASICRGDSYTFNGTAYTTVGTYATHLTNAVGCDSTATLQLTVGDPSSSATKASICRGESYAFGGTTYTTAGTFVAYLTNAVGCDSTATLILAVKEPSSSISTASICCGESYTFNGATYTTAGNYGAHLTNAVGCDSTATLQLSVREPSTSTTTASICRGESYTFNGTTYSTAGTYVAHLINAVGCDSTATLVLEVKEPSSSTTTASICRGENYTFNGVTYTTAGTYATHLTNAVGCDSIATLQLTVGDPSSSTTKASICRGESYSFGGAAYATAGTYVVHLVNAVGCDSTATLQLSIREPSSSTTTASICRGESYTFNGPVYTTAGTYAAHLTNVVGCDSTATLQLTVREPSSSTTTASICRGESYTFNGVTYTTAGTYATHLTNAVGCDSTATLQLIVREPSNSLTTASICHGESYLFNGQVYNSVGTYTVHFTNAAGCDSAAILQLNICYSQTVRMSDTIYQNQNYAAYGFSIPTQKKYGDLTFYQHKKTVQGCDSTVVLNLTVSPDFEVEVKPVPEICADDKYFTLTYEIKRGAVEFDSIAFASDALKMGFKNMKMQNAVGFIDIPLPSNVVPNKYNFSVVFRNGYIQKEVPVTIAINYASSVILQKWNDVLALLNSSYNGGYEFLSYQWYKNNQVMNGETRSYLYVKNGTLDTTAEYKAKVTRVSDGVALFTCPVVPVVKSDVAVFPTEFSAATNVTVRTTAPGSVVLMKSSGIRVKQQALQRGDNSMLVSVPSGNYVLVITNEQGDVKRQVLIVK